VAALGGIPGAFFLSFQQGLNKPVNGHIHNHLSTKSIKR